MVLKILEFACKDIEMHCHWETEAENLDILMEEFKVHTSEAHGIKEFPPDLLEKVKSSVRD